MRSTSNPREQIELQLNRRGGELFFRVRVRSVKKPEVISFCDVHRNVDRLPYAIQVAAAALAEKQNNELGDNHDPDMFARQALDCLKEIEDHINAARVRPADQDERLVQEGGAL